MGSISANRLGKAYRQYPTRWSRLIEWVIPFAGPRHQRKWVLRDVNFHIDRGESVGIIGVNGAGKSTLLKLITGTIQPTEGSAEVAGSVVALLELGMGFHPDFTGRQNVFMSGQLIGLGSAQISALMPDIESFAGIGDYIDQPVRTYSSGMQVRLAFSVATAVRPDILIVDEALAVGDIYFQQKCFERIGAIIGSGTTLLFVSHSMGTVMNLCSRAILLRHGRIVHDGRPNDAIELYQADLLASLDKAPEQFRVIRQDADKSASGDVPVEEPRRGEGALQGATGSIHTDSVECIGARFLDRDRRQVGALVSDEEATVELEYRVNRPLDDPHVGFKLKDRFGTVLFETNTYCMGRTIGPMEAHTHLIARFTFPLNVAADEYTLTAGFGDRGFSEGSFQRVLGLLHEVATLTVLPNRRAIKWSGLINLRPQVEFETIAAAADEAAGVR